MNTNKLLGKIKEKGLTIEQFATQNGFSLSSFRRKMKDETGFTREEINRVSKALDLTNEELLNIFFDSEVS